MCECLTKTKEKDLPDSSPLCVKDFERFLTERLPKSWSGFISGAADEWSTLQNNEESWKRLRIRPRCLTGVSSDSIDTSVEIFGLKFKSPIFMTPAGLQSLGHEDGEVATARACEKLGNCMVLSIGTTKSYNDVMSAVGNGITAAHIEVPRLQSGLDSLLINIKNAGFKFIVLTVDAVVHGNRLQDKRNGFSIPENMSVPVVEDIVRKSLGGHDISDELLVENSQPATYTRHVRKDISWEDVDYIVSKTDLPLVLKGILTAEDAVEAVRHGVKGIVVSNHGGRQLDTVLSTMEALPEIVEAVDGKIPVFVDGGIRLGTDVLKALALGAAAVFIGRPIFWGLAYKGQEGVERVFSILQEELERAMVLAGCKNLASITRNHVVHETTLWARFAMRDADCRKESKR